MGLSLSDRGHFYLHGVTLIPAWIGNHMHSNVWDDMTYQFQNFNGCTVGASSSKTWTYLFYIFNVMGADVVVKQEASASATTILA